MTTIVNAPQILILLCTVIILVLNIITWRSTRKLSKMLEESRKRVEIVQTFDTMNRPNQAKGGPPPAPPRPPKGPPRPIPPAPAMPVTKAEDAS